MERHVRGRGTCLGRQKLQLGSDPEGGLAEPGAPDGIAYDLPEACRGEFAHRVSRLEEAFAETFGEQTIGGRRARLQRTEHIVAAAAVEDCPGVRLRGGGSRKAKRSGKTADGRAREVARCGMVHIDL
jgi:hypothetical protein